MTAPERIWAGEGEYWEKPHIVNPTSEYILHTRAALAASPLVQEIVAEAVKEAIDMYVRAEDAGVCGHTAVAMWLRNRAAAIRARGEG